VTPTAPARSAAPLAQLVSSVQLNCDISDAQHARDNALCSYLLGMREYYRWATGAALGASLDRAAVGNWIAQQEQTWERLRETSSGFVPLPLAGGVDAFDEAAAERALPDRTLVYAAGVGRFGVALFFLAEHMHETQREGARVIVTGRELARGYSAPPAFSRAAADAAAPTIIVRLDALRRWLWSRVEGGQRADGAWMNLLRHYGGADAAAIERIAAAETETLILHELGELRAGALLGGDWERMLAQLDDRRTELVARAVRDLLADTLVTLPVLIERDAIGSLHFWFANFEGMRRALAPALAAPCVEARFGDLTQFAATVRAERERWQGTAYGLLERWRAGGRAELQRAALSLI
jgi:hypothetical protein